ncbi:MAG: hypothetical protein RIB50_13225 [Marinovum algicola]|uniref:hypothetical protein n=1 Tax=Marinovum algicola TaxID=42444 RepID=UPI0032EC2F0D
MNKTSSTPPLEGTAGSRPSGPGSSGPGPTGTGPSGDPGPGDGKVRDGRGAALDADLGELILLIGRIRRDLEGGDPLHCPDMKPLARRAERIVGLLPQLPRAEAEPLLPRLERVMRELDAVEASLLERKAVLDRSLAPGGGPAPAEPGAEGRHRR